MSFPQPRTNCVYTPQDGHSARPRAAGSGTPGAPERPEGGTPAPVLAATWPGGGGDGPQDPGAPSGGRDHGQGVIPSTGPEILFLQVMVRRLPPWSEVIDSFFAGNGGLTYPEECHRHVTQNKQVSACPVLRYH